MSYETNDKMVSHPDHYKSGKYEVIDIIDEFTKDLSGTEAVCTANAIKYILRWKKKNGIQDVKKAIWYLQHMVDKEEERLREEHAEFDEELLKKTTYSKEFVDEALKHIHENTEVVKNCKTCKHENDTCSDKCAYPNLIGWEPKEVDMDKIMNRPTFIDVKEEEIHSCDDCAFKVDDPNMPPCFDCDLHSNPPSKWVAEDENVTVTAKQAVYAAKVISKYCYSKSDCINGKCPFFDSDNSNGVCCKFRLKSPNAWDIEE